MRVRCVNWENSDRPQRSSFEIHVYQVSIFQDGSAGSVANACKLQQPIGERMEDIMDDIDATQAKDGSGTQASTGTNPHERNIKRW